MSVTGKIYGLVLGGLVNYGKALARAEEMKMNDRIGSFKCPKDYENTSLEYEGSKFQWLKKKERKTDKVIYYIHGGAFITGLVHLYHKMGINFSERTDADILLGDYYRFPPIYLTSGNNEILLSDSVTIKKKLEKEGIEVKHDICKGMFHAFPISGNFREAREYQKRIIAFMNEHFK